MSAFESWALPVQRRNKAHTSRDKHVKRRHTTDLADSGDWLG